MQNILLVEDNSALRLIELRYLKKAFAHANILVATTAEDAVAVARTVPLDVVILDCGLPDASDTQIIEMLMPHCPNAAMVVTSANPPSLDPRLDRIARNRSQIQILTKPFEPERLISLVHQSMTGTAGMPSLVENGPPDETAASIPEQRHDLLNILSIIMADVCAMELDLLSELNDPQEIRAILEHDVPSLKECIMRAAEKVKRFSDPSNPGEPYRR